MNTAYLYNKLAFKTKRTSLTRGPQTVDKAGCETKFSQPIFLFWTMSQQIRTKKS